LPSSPQLEVQHPNFGHHGNSGIYGSQEGGERCECDG
jgi:hypothetical protein